LCGEVSVAVCLLVAMHATTTVFEIIAKSCASCDFCLCSRSMNLELTEISSKLKVLQADIAEKRKFIDSIPVQLKAIEKVSLSAGV
jgi:hypothetical protein